MLIPERRVSSLTGKVDELGIEARLKIFGLVLKMLSWYLVWGWNGRDSVGKMERGEIREMF